MTDQRQSHATQGRRRRRKSPASIPSTQQLLLSRLLDHMNATDGPSDAEEEEEDAKRQRSAPTTPRSTSSIFRTNTMRLCASFKWNPRKRKGLRREIIQTFRMLKKPSSEKLTLVRKLIYRHLGLGKSMRIRQCHATRVC